MNEKLFDFSNYLNNLSFSNGLKAEISCFDEFTYYLEAKKVIFNPPATIVLWPDKTKTVVKCNEKDEYDKMKGLALCYMKKFLGNDSERFHRALKVTYED